jgi:putative isomerase
VTSVSAQRVWNTWDHRFPGSISHLASGLTLKVSSNSTTTRTYEDYSVNGSAGIRHGLHALDGSYNQVELEHGGNRLNFETAKVDWSTIVGKLGLLNQVELLFRFHMVLEFGFWTPEEGGTRINWRDLEVSVELEDVGDEHYRRPRLVYATYQSFVFCLAVDPWPIDAATYTEHAQIAEARVREGWEWSQTRASDVRWASMLYLGDPLTPVRFAVAQDTDRPAAKARALAALELVDETVDRRRAEAEHGTEPFKAVRDVMAWNTVWDPLDAMPYTALDRAWIDPMGGRGIFMSDLLYNGLMCAYLGDWAQARANVLIVLNSLMPAGHIPGLVTGTTQWADRTQLPVASYVVWRIFLITGDLSFLEEVYPTLKSQQDWYFTHRDGNGNGILEYGSDPTGHAGQAFTRNGAMNEPGMDNLPVFDDAVFVEESHTLDFEEPGHNSLVALDGEFLAKIAEALGRAAEAAALEARSTELRGKISAQLWDESRRTFAGRHWDGRFARHLAPTSFFPLIAGAATDEQARIIITEHLTNPEEYWGEFPLPATPFNDPVSRDNMYWRGKIWAPLNLFVYEGLRRYGYLTEASELARLGWKLFEKPWVDSRRAHENFNAFDADKHEAHDSETFYSWGALLPLLEAMDAAEFSPWSGLTVGSAGGGRVIRPGGVIVETVRDGDALTVSVSGHPTVIVTPAAALSGLVLGAEEVRMVLPPSRAGYEVVLPGVSRDRVPEVDGGRLAKGSGRVVVKVHASDDATQLVVRAGGPVLRKG